MSVMWSPRQRVRRSQRLTEEQVLAAEVAAQQKTVRQTKIVIAALGALSFTLLLILGVVIFFCSTSP
jgi:hypothetical protein